MTQQKVTVNPNPTTVSLTEVQEQNADLEQARSQITTLKAERDTLAGKINELDKEVANLKDENGKIEQQKKNLLNNFQSLYTMHEQLVEQLLSTVTASTITTGKLSEALAKFRFQLPEA